MTPVDEMVAGRELDALIAEKVMGEAAPELPDADISLNLFLAGSAIISPDGNWLCVHEFEKGDKPRWIPMSYSSDIKVAWRVVEKLRSDGFDFTLTHDPKTVARADFGRFGDSRSTSAHGEGDTAPLAICRAALSAAEDKEFPK